MHPAHTLLVDELVEWELQLLNEAEEAAVLLRRTGRALDIGGTASHVITCGRASHNSVETGAAIAAGDMDGLAIRLTQGVKDILNKTVDVVGLLQRRQLVVDAVSFRLFRTGELANGEILHRLAGA